MIRGQLQDAAVSAAKAYGHAEVEARHVLFALARRFREHPTLGSRFAGAKQALEPRGYAHESPVMTAEATALLDSIRSEEEAEAALAGAAGAAAGTVGGGPEAQEEQVAEASASQVEAVEAPQATETTGEILAELDALVGLDAVKSRVRSILAVVQANTERARAGLKQVNPSLHLVFTGPPGTGKTTVARIVARLYAAAGALPGSRFTEASRSDLVAGYVGQTAIRTREIIEKTRPGVLFIDEAYALTPKVDADYGHEAIATLVKAMEDYRSDLAVIVAGYGDEMAAFVGSNPGLRSRFRNYVDFPDYSASELTEIFARLVQDSGIELGDGVLERAARVFAEAADRPGFGNARFARSLFEHAYARMAARAAEDGVVTVDELTRLVPDDLDMDVETLARERRRIGFVAPDEGSP